MPAIKILAIMQYDLIYKKIDMTKKIRIAKSKDIPIITLSGFEPHNPLRAQGDLNLYLPIVDYGLVEMGHFFLLHTIIDSWNFKLTSNETTAQLSHAK